VRGRDPDRFKTAKIERIVENKGDACLHCPFRIDSTTCQLPIGKKGKPASPREHYQQYFGWPCHRTSQPDPNAKERR
jgi:hypothetical protein